MGRPKGSKNRPKDQESAPKPKAPKAPKPQVDFSANSEADLGFKKPNADQVVKLTKRLELLTTIAKARSAEVSEAIAKACESQHFDKTALSMVRKFYKLAKTNPEKFAVTFPHFLAYCDDLQLDKLANDAKRMDFDGDYEESDEDEDQIDLEDSIAASPARLQVVPTAQDEDHDVPPAPAEDEAA